MHACWRHMPPNPLLVALLVLTSEIQLNFFSKYASVVRPSLGGAFASCFPPKLERSLGFFTYSSGLSLVPIVM
jgi:hypothetical protein